MTMEQRPENMTPRRYKVVHRTTYTYNEPVTGCYERGMLAPRPTSSQNIVEAGFTVEPAAHFSHEHTDYFGNLTHYLEVPTHHSSLEITKTFLVDVAWPEISLAHLDQWTVGEAAELIAGNRDMAIGRALFLLDSAKVTSGEDVAEYAREKLPEDRPLGQALTALTVGIKEDFEYKPGSTTTRTTLTELLAQRQGVCQDFAHLAIGCLRQVGLPAAYVSGYIETAPPPGKPKLQGSDATHAWTSVLTPDHVWVDIDPTNAHFADSRYIVNGWGRDYQDVSPLKGVIFTESTSSNLPVGVDVLRLADPNVPLPEWAVEDEPVS